MVNWKILYQQEYSCILKKLPKNKQKEINLVLWSEGYYISPKQEAKLDIREWSQDHQLEGCGKNDALRGITFDKSEAIKTIDYLKNIYLPLIIRYSDLISYKDKNEIKLSKDLKNGIKIISLSTFSGSLKCHIRYWVDNVPTKKGITLDSIEALKVIQVFEKAIKNNRVWEKE